MIVRTLEDPDAVRVRSKGETIRVEAGDRWTGRVTAQLASKNSQVFTSTVLHTARLAPNEGSVHYHPSPATTRGVELLTRSQRHG